MNSQSKKTKVNEDVVHEHDNTAKTMLILKTHVHVDVDDWSSVDNKITMLHVLLNLFTNSSRHQLPGSVQEYCPMGLIKAV